MAAPTDTDPPGTGLSTAQIAAALNVTRQTVNNWKERGLLPAPTVVHLGARGKASTWPAYTLELAQYVQTALDARTPLADVARRVRPLLEKDSSWIEAQRASGRTIADLLRELTTAAGAE